MKKQVVTYAFAYVPGQITLCRNCEDRVHTAVPLGPILYGLHRDYCAGCEDDSETQANEGNMYKVGDTVYDYFTQENVKILEENTAVNPSVFTVEDEGGKRYFLLEDDMAPEQDI